MTIWYQQSDADFYSIYQFDVGVSNAKFPEREGAATELRGKTRSSQHTNRHHFNIYNFNKMTQLAYGVFLTYLAYGVFLTYLAYGVFLTYLAYGVFSKR